MNDRQKIKEILKQAQDELHRMFYEGVINSGGRFSTSDLNAIKPYDDVYADAFIAAGFGDVSEYKHRAEVAERALRMACDGRNPCRCVVCLFFSKCDWRSGACQWAEIRVKEFIRDAEQEIAEEA